MTDDMAALIRWTVHEFAWHDGTVLWSANCRDCEWHTAITPEDPHDAVQTHWDTSHHPLVSRD